MTASEHHFTLRVVQPALLGLMDGSVSTLAPIFASAYLTQQSYTAFLVGTATAVGAGISMGFAESLSDNGTITGRGHPTVRGLVNGAATFLGGILHALPFLVSDLGVALVLAYLMVSIELVTIAWLRFRFLGIGFARSIAQVTVGGMLVFSAAYLLGNV